MHIQEQIVVFLVENVLYSNESLLSIPCRDGTLYSNKEWSKHRTRLIYYDCHRLHLPVVDKQDSFQVL